MARRRCEAHNPARQRKAGAALHALITSNLEEGRLLPRTLDEITMHAGRFTIAMRGTQDRRLR